MSKQSLYSFGSARFVPPVNTALCHEETRERFLSTSSESTHADATESPVESQANDAACVTASVKQVRWSVEEQAPSPAALDATKSAAATATSTTALYPPSPSFEEEDWCCGRSAVSSSNETCASNASSVPPSPSRKRTCPTRDVFSAKRHEGPSQQTRPDPMLWMLIHNP